MLGWEERSLWSRALRSAPPISPSAWLCRWLLCGACRQSIFKRLCEFLKLLWMLHLSLIIYSLHVWSDEISLVAVWSCSILVNGWSHNQGCGMSEWEECAWCLYFWQWACRAGANAWIKGGAMTLCVLASSGNRNWSNRGHDKSKALTGAARSHLSCKLQRNPSRKTKSRGLHLLWRKSRQGGKGDCYCGCFWWRRSGWCRTRLLPQVRWRW